MALIKNKRHRTIAPGGSRGFINRFLVRYAPPCLIAAVCLSLLGCLTTEQMAPVARNTLDAQRYSPQQFEAFDAGRDIYLRDCSTCHAIEPINRYSLEEWTEILPDMSWESGLNEEQEKLLTDYVMTMRKAMPDLE